MSASSSGDSLLYLFTSERIEVIKKINEQQDPIFLPYEYIVENVMKPTCITLLLLTCLFLFLYSFISNTVVSTTTTATTTSSSSTKDDEKSSSTSLLTQQQKQLLRYKYSYQMTNLIMNCILGCFGIYYELVQQKNVNDMTILESIQGCDSFLFFTYLQLGYQCWAIPIGFFLVNEDSTMLLHHVSVIMTCIMSGFLTNGFRYYTPLCYGVIEVSSIPLAIMNSYKNNPHWISMYPIRYNMIRVLFTVSFLFLRVGWFVPRLITFLHDHFFLFFYHPSSVPYQIFMSIVWFCSFLLLLLQFYWAYLIIKAAYKSVFFSGDKKKQRNKKVL